jgi:hypothetical protein
MKRTLAVTTILAVMAFAGAAFATSYDYSDATDYDNSGVFATNATWNRLGTGWTGETVAYNNNGDSDDGVSWSIINDIDHNGVISVGDTVKFNFILSKVEWGQHTSDFLKVWVDWNNDKDFTDNGEMVLADTYSFTPVSDSSPYRFLNVDRSPKIVATYSYEKTFTADDIGSYWLRARVVCNGDVSQIVSLSPTGSYYQGEIEDWTFTVNRTSVPEPATMLLLGFGLVGLAGLRRKFSR